MPASFLLGTASMAQPVSCSHQYLFELSSATWRLMTTRRAASRLSGVAGWGPSRPWSVSRQASRARSAFAGDAVTDTRYQPPLRRSWSLKWKFASYVSCFRSRTTEKRRRFATSWSSDRATAGKSGWRQRSGALDVSAVPRSASTSDRPSAKTPRRFGAAPAMYATARGSLSETWTRRGASGFGGSVVAVAPGGASVAGFGFLDGTEPTYSRASASVRSASTSPTTLISTFAGSSWAMTQDRTSSKLSASAASLGSDRNRASSPNNCASSASCAAPSMEYRCVSVCCWSPRRARWRASGSHLKAPGMRILWTSWSAASTPSQPPVLGGGVGNPKSMVM
mmetsp:Transcript_23794/g.76867  ORF Transcript_23794/g.76867 Transcript_23794/m.76867 type:complete len:338 (+) Transcript_23794:267-1280(+)